MRLCPPLRRFIKETLFSFCYGKRMARGAVQQSGHDTQVWWTIMDVWCPTRPLGTSGISETKKIDNLCQNIYNVLICFFTRLRQLMVRELFDPFMVTRHRGAPARASAGLVHRRRGHPGVPATHPGLCLTIVRYPVLICYRYLPVFTIGRIFFMLIFRTSRQGSIAELTESRPNRCILT